MKTARLRRLRWPGRPERPQKRTVRWQFALRLFALLIVPLALPVQSEAITAQRPLVAPAAPESLRIAATIGTCAPDEQTAGKWHYLSDIPWQSATSGWQAIADVAVPERDRSFRGVSLALGGTTYEKGLLTHPLAEVTYQLNGRYSALQAIAGLTENSPDGASTVFLVYADDALVYNSGVVAAGEPPRQIDLCVAGVDHLRLVTAGAGQRTPAIEHKMSEIAGGYAAWVDPRIFRPDAPAPATPAVRRTLAAEHTMRWEQVIGEQSLYQEQGVAEMAALVERFGPPGRSGNWPRETQMFRDEQQRLVLANRRLAVLFGFAGAEHATLTVVDTRNGTLVVTGAGSAISSAAGVMSVADWTIPAGDDAYSLDRIDDPALGSGGEIRATLRLRDRSEATATVRLALFDEQPYLTYQLTLENWPLPDTRPDDTPTPIRLDYLSASGAAFVAGESMRYFADASYVREAELEDDGLWRNVRLGIGSPAVIWGSARPGAIVLAMLGEQRLPAWLVLRRDPGRAAAAAGISQPMLVPDEAAAPATKIAMAAKSAGTDATPTSLAGPRLLLEVTDTPDLRAALANYRRISEALYPPAPLPDWVRYQWGSWWVYGSGVDEERMRQHIDLISTYLGDLGPWHILIDGGWQDLGWDGSGDLRRANPERFPSGLRALVDYAHARGIRVIVLYSAVYAHDGTGFGEWLAQPRLITEHPEWFRRLAPPDSPSSSYMFDYSSPAARRYLAGVLATYVVDHDADGVKIDGLGDVEGQLIPFSERTINFSDRWMLTPVVDIYRMVAKTVLAAKPDAFIESGWVNPPVAHQYAHSFRYGDELNRSDNEYPFPGLLQHFRYGAIQRALLNQRPNIGAIYGGFNTPVADQWLGAALALGAQVSLGSDLNFLTPEGFAALRAMLVHQRPFAGTTRIGPEHYGLRPAWAATTIGGLTFVGLANEQPDTQRIEVPLSEVLPAGARDTGGTPGTGGGDYLAYDVFQNRFARVEGVLAADVPAHGLALIVLRRTPGVVWTTSSYSETTSSAGWHVYVRGPANVQGRLQFHLPRTAPSTAPGAAPRAAPGAVLLDGRRLGPLTPDAPEGHDYDPATGVLTLRYRHAGLATDAASQSPVRVIDVLR